METLLFIYGSFSPLFPDDLHFINLVYIAYITNEKQNRLFGKHVQVHFMNHSDKTTKDLTLIFYGCYLTSNTPKPRANRKKLIF